MRTRNYVAIALTVTATVALNIALDCSTSFAQTTSSSSPQPVANYSWRVSGSAPNATSASPNYHFGNEYGGQVSNQRLGIGTSQRVQPLSTQSERVSSAHQRHLPPLRVARLQDNETGLQDTQPSVSDVQQIVEAPSVMIPQADPGQPIVDNSVERATEIPAAPHIESTDLAPHQQGVSSLYSEPGLSVVDAGDSQEPNYCYQSCKKDRCNLGCERKLFGTNSNGLEIGGWTSIGYHNRDTILFNNRKGEGNLHQSWLYFDKQAGVTSDWGYRLDLLYGIDAQDTQAYGNAPTGAPTGWDNSWDFGSYGWALPQAYLQYKNDCWDVKLGKFFSPFGYEVTAATENFFYSHSYTMYNSEPFTMTGVLGERQISDTRSMILGVTAGWDSAFESNTGGFNLITGTRLKPNENVDLALTTSYGDTGYRDTGTLTSAVGQFQLTENLQYVFQGDFLSIKTNQEFGILHYLYREINPCLKLGARFEWWKTDRLFPDTKSTYDFTMGANYRPSANVTLRPELRFDWGAAAIDPGTPIFGIDAVVTY